jgi:FtsZ-binding cell division protein ZapB
MAQDFYAAFGLGQSETGLSSIDTAGVALAAIQALNEKLIDQNEQLVDHNHAMQTRLSDLEQLYQRMEQQQQQTQAMLTGLLGKQQATPVVTSTVMN